MLKRDVLALEIAEELEAALEQFAAIAEDSVDADSPSADTPMEDLPDEREEISAMGAT